MVKHHNLRFVILDGGHARFVKPASDNALHTEEALDSTHAHSRTSDLVSDRHGRSFESGSATRHAYTPRHDPHDLDRLRFAQFIGEKLVTESAAGAFNELVVVAPSDILAAVTNALDHDTTAKIIGSLAKDLVKVPDHELWPHLKEWVRPVHRAG